MRRMIARALDSFDEQAHGGRAHFLARHIEMGPLRPRRVIGDKIIAQHGEGEVPTRLQAERAGG